VSIYDFLKFSEGLKDHAARSGASQDIKHDQLADRKPSIAIQASAVTTY
jgi:hypothetical protein